MGDIRNDIDRIDEHLTYLAGKPDHTCRAAIDSLRARLAEPEGQEPVAEVLTTDEHRGTATICVKRKVNGGMPLLIGEPLYTTPPPAPSVPEMLVATTHESPEYAMGWNDCRTAMLTDTPAPPRSESVVKAEALDLRWRVTDTSDEAEAHGIAGSLYAAGYEDAHEGRNYHPQKNPVWQKAFGKIFDALRAARLRSEGRE